MAADVATLETSGRSVLASILIAFYNTALPFIMKILNKFEPHATVTNRG